ncbi:ALDH-like protein [Thelephora ganbajun]|uniref:ALDH-like protein n=1 Tax=Thelephora ganbajun TaxID=370292 RepID=A0ACB6ZYC0_THEGA|nr:ALDH-like protein [Thelephora ganbajun]
MSSYPHIDDIHFRLRTTYNDGITFPLEYRRKQPRQLALLVQDNSEQLYAALQADLNKPKFEAVVTELLSIVNAYKAAIEKLDEWATPERPRVPEWRQSFDISTHPVPKGVALMISSSMELSSIISLLPLVGAIAAGCPAVVKPSEVSSNVADILADLFPKYLDPNAYAVVKGAVPETTYLLSLKWDFILFTGGCAVGKVVASAAAKNITPCALELGGMSPVVVADDADIDLKGSTFSRKKQNSGQLCVSPNHVLIPRHLQDNNITNANHHKRLLDLLANSEGHKILGGGHNEGKIELTILKDVPADDPLVKDPSPLVAYLFTNQQELRDKFLREVRCGSLVQNDCVQQLEVPELLLGGVGESGYGVYGGKHTFDMFMDVPSEVEPSLEIRSSPYRQSSLSFFEEMMRAPLPEL